MVVRGVFLATTVELLSQRFLRYKQTRADKTGFLLPVAVAVAGDLKLRPKLSILECEETTSLV
jgi:hypothetical protein